MDMQTPSKRFALVTGANKGLGFEIARQIGRTGVIVLLGARNKTAGEEAASRLGAGGIDAHVIAIDVADYASIEAAASSIITGFGRLGILVNNAGTALQKPFDETTEAEFDQIVNVHFKGVYFLTQKPVPLIRDGGRIVNPLLLSKSIRSLDCS
jgi:NAD(P)-dependent dehydrogenase (short-subunit alcohol dehydrogenase family)